MNTRRAMGVVCGLSLAIALMRNEWTSGFAQFSFFQRIATAVVPLGILVITGFFVGAFRYRGDARRLFVMVLGACVFGAIVFAHSVAPSGVVAAVNPDFYVVLAQMAVCAAIGYWMAHDARDARWVLSRCALCLALVSVYGGIVRLLGVGELSPYLAPGFPVRLFILFAYCWYLHQWLTGPRWSVGALLGIVACSPELILAFHKPVVFCTGLTFVFMFVYSIWATRRVYAVVTRCALLIVLGALVFIAADVAQGSRISAHVKNTIKHRYLHASAAERYESLFEKLERVAGGRFELWRSAASRFTESPIVGSGFGQNFSPGSSRTRGVNVHNGYLDLLIAAGIVGALPVIAGLIWWLTLVSRRSVTRQMGTVVTPCLAYVVSIMVYNVVGCSQTFFALNSFVVFVMAIAAGLADQALATARRRRRATVRSYRPVSTAGAHALTTNRLQ